MTSRETAAKLKSNIWMIYVINFLGGLMFFLPIYALYLQQELFTLFNVGLIIAIPSIFITLFEIPSGAIADLFGRKNTLIVSGIISVIALVFLSTGTSLIFFIIYGILMALFRSLHSGTDVALLFDSVQGINKQAKKEAIALSEASVGSRITSQVSGTKTYFKKVVGINGSMWQLGASISAILGGILATQSLRLPIIATIIPFTLALILTFFLTEPKYTKEKHSNILLHISKSAKLFVKKKQLSVLLLTGFLFFAFGEVAHELNSIFFSFKLIPIEYFGLLFAFIFGASSLGALISNNVSNKLGNKNTLILSAIISPLLILGATFVLGIGVGILIVISSLFYGLRRPITTHLTNLETSSKNRATVISIGNLGNRLGLAICAPIFGALSDIYNINYIFQLLSGLSFTVVFVLLFLKDKN